jgi:hypothetical protein
MSTRRPNPGCLRPARRVTRLRRGSESPTGRDRRGTLRLLLVTRERRP